MTNILCSGDGPPCTCKAEHRGNQCEMSVRTADRRAHEDCMKPAKFREDANDFWSHKMVLCDECYIDQLEKVNRPCGICGSKIRNCVC